MGNQGNPRTLCSDIGGAREGPKITIWQRPSRRQFLRWGVGVLALGGLAPRGAASRGRPSTSRASREEALRAIPFAQLVEPVRAKVRGVVEKPTIYRRMPIEVIPCDPELYLFLIRYPEVIVNMWHLMGVTKVEITRTGPYTYDATDGAGTSSTVELLFGTRNTHLFLAEGYYDGVLAPRKIAGRCVLLLSTGYSKDARGRNQVSNRLDVFVQMDNAGVELIAKTLHPLFGKTADSNFSESTRFLSQVSHVVKTNGPGVQRLATRLTKIDATVRAQFAQLAADINQRAMMRSMIDAQKHGPSARVSDRSPGVAALPATDSVAKQHGTRGDGLARQAAIGGRISQGTGEAAKR